MSHVIGKRTFTAGEDLVEKRLVWIKAATTTTPPEIVYCDNSDTPLGVVETDADSGDLVAVRLLNSDGTFDIECTLGSSISIGDSLYPADDGKVSDAAVGTARFVALEAGVESAQIECAKLP